MPEPALDRVLSRAWRDLSAHRSADCPMCGEAMIPRYGVHARPIGGRCASCGTELS
jgi:predicted RNA-binding Zn-ribbon protein involved in translation (DUF1610 family)